MRKSAKQARSRKTRETLLLALETLLKQKDFDQISVVEIAESAGVSAGLLYAHFTNKADFLEALLETYKARVISRLDSFDEEKTRETYHALRDLRQSLRLIARHTFNQVLEDQHLIRALNQFLRTRSDCELTEWRELRDRAAQTIVLILDVYQDTIERDDRPMTDRMLVYFFNSIYQEAIHNQGSLDRIDNSDSFADEIADFAFGYLMTSASTESLTCKDGS